MSVPRSAIPPRTPVAVPLFTLFLARHNHAGVEAAAAPQGLLRKGKNFLPLPVEVKDSSSTSVLGGVSRHR